MTARQRILDFLCGLGGSCIYISSVSYFGSVEEDAALEITGVHTNEKGALNRTGKSLQTSLYSSLRLMSTKTKLFEEYRKIVTKQLK